MFVDNRLRSWFATALGARYDFRRIDSVAWGGGMADDKLTEIACIVDQSGSMYSVKRDAIGGFNQFLDEQRECDGRVRLTLTLFSHRVENVWTSLPIERARGLTDEIYQPDGMTALMDAVGETIEQLEQRFEERERGPDHVLVLILTDGRENASRSYRREQVADMIDRRETERDWEFVFWGATIDATRIAGKMSIDASNVSQFEVTGDGLEDAFGEMSRLTQEFRESGLDEEFSGLREDSEVGT